MKYQQRQLDHIVGLSLQQIELREEYYKVRRKISFLGLLNVALLLAVVVLMVN